METDDVALAELADAILDGRPFAWIAARADAHASTRGLIPHLRIVADIFAMARASSAASDALRDDPLLPGSTWGPLTIVERIGRGSFGDVYRALDPTLDRPVALKVLRRESTDAAGTTVVDEGRLMARVRHPNVVTVFGAERVDGRVGLWMEFVDGRSLEEDLEARGPLSGDEALAIGVDLCRALEAIHRAGLIHRDLKAQNVLRDRDGRVVVTDFGAGLDLTLSDADRELAGTPLYLAPEVLAGTPASVQSDIYSTGVLLFHLLTGSYPVTGRSLEEVWVAHRARHRQHLERVRRDLGPLVPIVDRALAFHPAARYASARDMESALLAATPDVSAGSGNSRRRRSWWAVPASAALAAVVWWQAYGIARPSDTVGLVVPQRILMPAGQIGVPSPNGSAVPYIDTSERAQIWDVDAHGPRRLTRDDSGVVSDTDPVIAPDGRAVAFVSLLADETWELRVLETDGHPRRPLIARQSAYQPIPQDWSRDRRHVLCWFRQKNGSVDLALVPVAGGQPRVVHTFTHGEPSGARLSPDGRMVAAVIGVHDPAPRTDLLLFDLAGGEPQVLAAGVAPFTEPSWVPDGTGVLFMRASPATAGAHDGWLRPLAGARAAGDAVRIAPDLGNASWVHLFDSGLLGRVHWTVSTDVYTVPVDLSGRTPPGPPTRVSPERIGNHVAPAWSPDGRSLAYFTTRPSPALGAVPLKTLTIKDLTSGAPRDVATPLGFLGGYTPEWAPDSASVVLWGSDDGRDDRLGYYRVDVQTGATSALVIRGLAEPASSAVSPEGRRFFYRQPHRGIVARDLITAGERVVVDIGGGTIASFRLAPDGRSVAFTREVGHAQGRGTTLLLQPVDGLRARKILHVDRPEQLRVQAWSSDGTTLLYTRASGNRPHQLWAVSVHGGTPTPLGVSFIRSGGSEPNGLSLSPDGRRITYAERVVQSELWIDPLVPTQTTDSPR